MFDVVIIGAGPAGRAAAHIFAKHNLKAILFSEEMAYAPISEEFELLEPEVFDINTVTGSGSLEMRFKTAIILMEKNVVSFSLETSDGKIVYARSVIIATGNQSSNFESLTLKTPEGKIKVDQHFQSNILGVFAAGSASDAGAETAEIAAAQGFLAAHAVLKLLQ